VEVLQRGLAYAAAPAGVIVRAARALLPADAARRVAAGADPIWLSSPGLDAPGGRDVAVDVVAAEPRVIVRGSALEALEGAWAEARARWSAGPGTPVAVGWLSYDLFRAPGLPRWGKLELRFYDAFWVRDAAAGHTQIHAATAAAATALRARLGDDGGGEPGALALGALTPLEPPAAHLGAVERALEYVRAGDIYQVNLARRLRARYRSDGPPGLDLFARLATEAAAPHAVWLADAERGRALVGNSPERFLRVTTDGIIETCTIKGTRGRGGDAAGDQAALAELLSDPKDRAEHVMIVDLERNDLGRVCATGTVHVAELMRPLSLPSVHHLVSTVRGRLRPGLGLQAILAATFPGGSVTGAPKVRAMQIIDELEPAPRGPYTGATGWLGAAGDLDLAVAIRTALVDGDELTLWVGGGIVADSDPQAELAETTAKAVAFARLSGEKPD